ncbi:hypothetical protein [Streptomyces anulatus]|uniref:hypothetical protein n=1 Tax=Streptomyces anulatus TaxID=1892 RepID=UPI002F91B881
MSRVAAAAIGCLLGAVLVGCSSPSPAEAGEEYGSTVVHSDPLVTCTNEAIQRYPDNDADREAFRTACKERAGR